MMKWVEVRKERYRAFDPEPFPDTSITLNIFL
jgi:hypothetical protein